MRASGLPCPDQAVQTVTGVTDHLTPPTVPPGLLADKNVGLQEPVIGTSTTGSHETYVKTGKASETTDS
jgi:hypothetical protein